MDIGKLHSSEPGGRKDPKVEAARNRDPKKLDKSSGSDARHGALEAQDSVSFSAGAIELRDEVRGYVDALRRAEDGKDSQLNPERLSEIRQKLENGHYEQAAILESAARRMRTGFGAGLDGRAQV